MYDDNAVVVDDAEDDIEGEGPTVEFYDVDFANSTFTLEQGGEETAGRQHGHHDLHRH